MTRIVVAIGRRRLRLRLPLRAARWLSVFRWGSEDHYEDHYGY